MLGRSQPSQMTRPTKKHGINDVPVEENPMGRSTISNKQLIKFTKFLTPSPRIYILICSLQIISCCVVTSCTRVQKPYETPVRNTSFQSNICLQRSIHIGWSAHKVRAIVVSVYRTRFQIISRRCVLVACRNYGEFRARGPVAQA